MLYDQSGEHGVSWNHEVQLVRAPKSAPWTPEPPSRVPGPKKCEIVFISNQNSDVMHDDLIIILNFHHKVRE